jgi:hypothetical protein
MSSTFRPQQSLALQSQRDHARARATQVRGQYLIRIDRSSRSTTCVNSYYFLIWQMVYKVNVHVHVSQNPVLV